MNGDTILWMGVIVVTVLQDPISVHPRASYQFVRALFKFDLCLRFYFLIRLHEYIVQRKIKLLIRSYRNRKFYLNPTSFLQNISCICVLMQSLRQNSYQNRIIYIFYASRHISIDIILSFFCTIILKMHRLIFF